jgi:PhnB protein
MIGVHPYIAFKGNCREAIDFYKQALGAEEIFRQTFGESPMPDMGNADGIMHCSLKIGDTNIMMCDDPRHEGASGPSNISLAIGMDDTSRARTVFDALADGGNVTMPLDKTFWAEAFGMVTDKFGINWMVNCDTAHDADKSAAA